MHAHTHTPPSPPPPHAHTHTDKLEQFESECDDLFTHFQHRNLEALVLSVRSTLDALRRRITTSSSGRSSGIYSTRSVDESSRPVAAFLAELVLSLPNVIMQPSLEEVQNAVNTAVQYVSEIGGQVPLWAPLHPQSTQSTPRNGASHSQSEWAAVRVCASLYNPCYP